MKFNTTQQLEVGSYAKTHCATSRENNFASTQQINIKTELERPDKPKKKINKAFAQLFLTTNAKPSPRYDTHELE
jgi:hypothetical protein